MMTKEKELKVFIGWTEIAGYFGNLAAGFREHGVECQFADIYGNKYGYTGSSENRLINQHRNLFEKQCRSPFLFAVLIELLMSIVRFTIFFKSLMKYNVFIFESFNLKHVHFLELLILKVLRKKIVFTFLGSDSRPPYIAGNVIFGKASTKDGNINFKLCQQMAKKLSRRVKFIENYADYCINHTASAHFHNKPFIPWLEIGFPFSLETDTSDCGSSHNPDVMRIVHAPSNPQTKGTAILREIIKKLKNRGLNIEYREVINQPNAVVLEELRKCDLVVDELYSDISLGGLGTEAAYFGKPTLNGGYYGCYLKRDFKSEVCPPSFFVEPNELENQLVELINNKRLMTETGADAQNFVREKWTSRAVASRYIKLLKDTGSIPSYDPNHIDYIYGYGLSKKKSKQVLNEYINTFGAKALYLGNKYQLTTRFIDFAKGTGTDA